MELLRTRSTAWGQEVLEGANLDLVGWFGLAGVILIVLHMSYAYWSARQRKRGS